MTTLAPKIQSLNIDNSNQEQIDEDMIIQGIKFVNYKDESQIDIVMKLVGRDLSEPYSIFTYRYFLTRFPDLCIFAVPENDPNAEPIGCIVCKVDPEEDDQMNENEGPTTKLCGYIGMLAVDTSHRRSGIGSALVKRAVRRMEHMGCSSIMLETEVTNKAAMKLYEDRLGFMREEFLVRYYLNNNDAYRLRLWLKD
ncbi:N-alpha-acetyltransferase 30 [Chaetoceros tenuissimus]|uniref:N-alpha-acetyltransferase 30 n=1 Tax=Chaetoceros tenuissimus TaxID=426638 RepID=A0AAD3DB62_9STRA|nr:N-alpha-acetyltransferase 30 [Chaetoceros tenuissimus]